MPSIYTLRNLAEVFRVPAHRISYAIRVHQLEPTTRVAKGIRLWTDDDLPRIREALRRTGALQLVDDKQLDGGATLS